MASKDLYKLDSLDEDDQLFLGIKPNNNNNGPTTTPNRTIPGLSFRTTTTDATKVTARIQPRRVRKIHRIATIEENLYEDFLSTPWRIPSIDKAKEYKQEEVYRGGEGNMSKIKIIHAAELGVGVRMYFQFLKSMGCGLFFMTLLTLPMIFFALKGKGIALEDQDVLQLYRFSLGNIGLSPSTTFSSNDYSLNTTIATAYGIDFNYGEASFIITICEVLQIFIFLIIIIHLKRRLKEYNNQEITKNTVTITHYSIYVENLPEDVTEEELVKHFSSLYPLDKIDWKKRPAVEDARSVQNCDNTGDPLYINTWIAECIIHRKIGQLITTYKKNEKLLTDLYRSRAKMKMYAVGTAHGKGPDEKRFIKAEESMLTIAQKVDVTTDQSRFEIIERLKKMKIKSDKRKKKAAEAEKRKKKKQSGVGKGKKPAPSPVIAPLSPEGKKGNDFEADLEQGLIEANNNKENNSHDLGNDTNLHLDHPDDASALTRSEPSTSSNLIPVDENGIPHSPRLTYTKKAPVVGAFIVFEYNESFARCIEDFNKYSNFPYNSILSCYYPKQLKLRGLYKLKVTRALEPDQIIWENLEVSPFIKRFNRYRTYLLTIFIIVVCFILILFAANLRFRYSNQIPTDNMCEEVIPDIYTLPSQDYESLSGTVQFVRPPPLEQSQYDSNCSRYISNSIYTVYSNNNDFLHPIVNYSYDACIFIPYNYSNYFFKSYFAPSYAPSPLPSYYPTSSPSISKSPTATPTFRPSYNPTFLPSEIPTEIPTTATPSESPTVSPSVQPTSTATIRRRLTPLISEQDIIPVYGSQFDTNQFNYSFCPAYNQPVFCPCLGKTTPIDVKETQGPTVQSVEAANQKCSSLQCQLKAASESISLSSKETSYLHSHDGSTCQTFTSKTVSYCYCKQIISDTKTFTKALQHFFNKLQFWSKQSSETKLLDQSQAERDESFCSNFTRLLILNYTFTFISIIIIVCINYLLNFLLIKLTSLEKHSSLDEEQSSIFHKLFISTYINTSMILLLAYGIDINIMSLTIDRGKYTDFIRSWYGNNGFSLLVSVTLTVIAPIIDKYIRCLLIPIIQRYFAYNNIKKKLGHSIVMQYDLNRLEVGPIFLPTLQFANVLALLFITMTFTTGLPLLTPIAMIGFILYFRIDKYLVGRYYRKPSVLDDRMIRAVIHYLPYAAIIRCVFSIWMLSSSGILPQNFPVKPFLFGMPNQTEKLKSLTSGYLDVSSISMIDYRDFLKSLMRDYKSYIPSTAMPVYQRILQMNTFPIFVLLIIVLIYLFITYFYYIFPVQAVSEWYYRRTLLTKKKTAIFANARAKGHVHPFDLIITSLDPLRQEAAPFTGIYYQFLTKNKTQAEEELKPKTCCNKYCCCFTFLFSFCGCCKKKTRDEEMLKDDEIDLNEPDSEDEGDIEGGGRGKPFDPNQTTNGEPMSWMKWFQQCYQKASPKEVMNTVIAATTVSKSEKKRRIYIKHHEKLDGWEITDMGFEFEVKVKKWPKTSKSKDSNAIRLKGQHKKTFEVVNDFRCNTYHMSGIPNYALVYSYIYNQEIDNDGVLVAVEGVSRRNHESVLNKRMKVYSYVDYYLSNWKKENYHKIFNPDRIEQELVKFDEKQKEKQQNQDKKKNGKQASRVLPFNDDDTNSYASGDALSNTSGSPRRKPMLGRGSSYNSQPSNEEEETKSSASAELKNIINNNSNNNLIPSNEEKKEGKEGKKNEPDKKKRTFVIDEKEEESEESEEEESDDDDEEDDDESEEETDDESEEEEEESEEESGEEDDDDEEEEEEEG